MTESIELELLQDQNERLSRQAEVLLEHNEALRVDVARLTAALNDASLEIQRLNMVSKYTE
jgi:hypothetical protein